LKLINKSQGQTTSEAREREREQNYGVGFAKQRVPSLIVADFFPLFDCGGYLSAEDAEKRSEMYGIE